jgi:hypothetical protein
MVGFKPLLVWQQEGNSAVIPCGLPLKKLIKIPDGQWRLVFLTRAFCWLALYGAGVCSVAQPPADKWDSGFQLGFGCGSVVIDD